jgi:tetratricopeptide (TPR) repeat protein
MIQYELYIQQAVKLENSKSIFEFISNDITFQRYEKISELYEKAGNICKLSNKELAIKYFNKAYNYLVNLNSDDYKLKILLSELSELYLKINYMKSIECLEKILNWYTIKGDISNVIKTKKSIGDIYFDNNCLKDAYLVYIDIIEIINSNDKCIDVKRNIVERIGEIYYNNESIINLLELSKLYFTISDDYLKKNIGYISARNFILDGTNKIYKII